MLLQVPKAGTARSRTDGPGRQSRLTLVAGQRGGILIKDHLGRALIALENLHLHLELSLKIIQNSFPSQPYNEVYSNTNSRVLNVRVITFT